MSTSFPISGSYPGLEFDATESLGMWHEDREVNGAMYRVTNAHFDGSSWSLKDTLKPGFAIIQNPDGSVGHLYQPPTSSTFTWQGSPTNTFFNAVDYGLTTTDSLGTINPGALLAALQAASLAGGGIVYIPAGSYNFDGTVLISTTATPPFQDVGIIIAGAGGSTELVQLGNNDTFSLSGLSSGRGVRFRDLRITYAAPEGGPYLSGRAIYATSCQNVTCERVYFSNCPQSLYLDSGTLQCGLFDCTIDFELGGINARMIHDGGTEDFVVGCLIQQAAGNTPSGCIGIKFDTSHAPFVSGTSILGFQTGVEITGGDSLPMHGHFSNLNIEAWTTAVMIGTSSSDEIRQVFFGNCVFARTDDSSDTTSTGVVIDTNHGAVSNVSDIFFDNCMCYQWNGPGIQIVKAQDVVISGGRYGSCATSAGTSGGISVTDAAANVTVVGADLTPAVPGYGTQPYAISVTGAVAGLYITGCDVTGYSGAGPLYVSVTGSFTLEVTECAGYNDQGKIVFTTAPASGVTFTSATYQYYGPVEFFTSSNSGATITGISLQGHTTHLTSGSFWLSAGGTAYAAITYTGLNPNFLMIGH